MKNNLLELFSQRFQANLRRQSITSPSRWACDYRMMGKPFVGKWVFEHHPWLRGMHDSKAQSNVGQKSAQVGYTETVLNITFYKMDIERVDCLYVLPAKTPDASDFSASRFDGALELSPHLTNMFSEVKNVGHKRAGSVNLYIRGSRSRSGLKSIPAGFIVLDEVDEMDQENIPLAMERASGQPEKQDWKISTPTIEGFGINVYFAQSTQEHFMFKCPHCSRFIELTFPDSLVITARDVTDPEIKKTHLICTQCKGVLAHDDKINFLSTGQWEATNTEPDVRGFYINQLYSPAVKPQSIAEKYLNSLSDATAEQEFYNSCLGLTHATEGAQISDTDIIKCLGAYPKQPSSKYDGIITMGVDVGRVFHCEITQWYIPDRAPLHDINIFAKARVIWEGKVINIEDVDKLMIKYNIKMCVIDANPETRVAIQFANRHYGKVRLCYYNAGTSVGKLIIPSADNEMCVRVDRTSWLDLSLGRFHRGKDAIEIPHDVSQEYRDHLKNQVRKPMKDKDGNPIAKYVTPNHRADHFGHARNYSEIALPLALGVGIVTSTGNPL